MPRSVRVEYPGAHYHAMCRGNNGQDIFESDKGRRLFLSTLEEVGVQTGWRIHAYVLMFNYYHLLVETPEANLVAGMKWFQGTYTQRFNAMFKRRGHLFQGRYKAIPVATHPMEGGLEYFRAVSTYIHLNPFRADLYGKGLKHPLEDYTWSSYPAYCGKVRKPPEWLVRKKVLGSWEITEGKRGCYQKYRKIIEGHMGSVDTVHTDQTDTIAKQIKRGWYIGSDAFRNKLDDLIMGCSDNDNLRAEQRRQHGEAEAERLLKKALRALHRKETDVLSAKSVDPEKQAIAWLLKTYTTVSGSWISERLNMGHRVNSSRAISRFRRNEDKQTKALKRKMLKCTG